MIESRRKSDTKPGHIEQILEDYPRPALPRDPLESRHIAMVNQLLAGVHELDAAHEEIRHLTRLAYTDKLTELANQRRLEEAFDEAVEKNDQIVLLFIDLNKFKAINDTYGHGVGDEALRLVAKKLESLARRTDVIARIDENKTDEEHRLPVRYAGDEFIILFTGATLKDLQHKVADVKEALSNLSLQVGNQVIPVTASVGAYERQPGDNLETCKKNADAEMYADKEANRNNITHIPFSRFAANYIMPPATTGYIPLNVYPYPTKVEPS